jgi:N-acetylglucosamine-6-phosphate deacetylase
MESWLLKNGYFVFEQSIKKGSLLIKDGVIQAFYAEGEGKLPTLPQNVQQFDCKEAIVGPGFIDIHVHGGGGADVMDASIEAFQTMASAHGQFGTTRFLLTTVTASHDSLISVCKEVKKWYESLSNLQEGAKPLGIHLEGPYIASEKKGAQNGEFVRPFSMNEIEAYQRASNEKIKLITLAPETLEDQKEMKTLTEMGIVVSIGHTEATYEQVDVAVKHGATHFTHLCNAMPGIHHRNPGPITYALTHDGVTTEFIADGLHVHPAMITLALRSKKLEEVAIITDAMRAMNMGDGEYELGKLRVIVQDGKATLPNGSLAGSCLNMEKAYHLLSSTLALDPIELFSMMSSTPAKIVGVDHLFGRIERGKIADLVLIREGSVTDVMVEGTWIKGGVTT